MTDTPELSLTEGKADLPAPSGRALVLVPVVRGAKAAEGAPDRDTAARVEEAAGLARAIDLDVVETIAVPLGTYRPATLFGTGKVEEIGGRVAADNVGLVIVDHTLSPVQQRNLEKAWKAKVIDRTGLILEIFGERAADEGRAPSGRTRPSLLPEEPPGAELDPP